MGVKNKSYTKRKRSKFNSFIIVLTKLTAVAFVILLTVWFVMDSDEFPLFRIFDSFFSLDEEEEIYDGNVNVSRDEINARMMGIDRTLETQIFNYFRQKYEAFDTEVLVTINYINAVFEGTYAIIELEESVMIIDGFVISGVNHIFDLRKAQNKWRIIAHEIRDEAL
jgi:hypothetical protein